MRIRRNIALTLCAALLLALGVFFAPEAQAAISGVYVGDQLVEPGADTYLYYRYDESKTPALAAATAADYNVALMLKGEQYFLTLNGVTVTRAHGEKFNESFSVHTCVCLPATTQITVMGVNSLTAPSSTAYGAYDGSFGLLIGDGSCSLSGPGKLTAQGGSGAQLQQSEGIFADGVSISSGDFTVSGGDATDLSTGLSANIGAFSMTGGTLKAFSATENMSSVAVGIYATENSSITGGTLLAYGKTRAFFIDSGASFSLGNQAWYRWKRNAASASDPGGDYTESSVTKYTLSNSDRYIHIQPLLSVAPSVLDFGSAKDGYSTLPAEQTITITNNRNTPVTLVKTGSTTHYNILPNSDSSPLLANEAKTFEIQPIARLTAGEYNETFSFVAGDQSVSIPVHFTVTPVAPVITEHPKNKAVSVGEKADFSIYNTGTTPFACQWQVSTDGGVNWSDIADTIGTGSKTNAYRTPDATADMNGWQYRCVVTNTVGSATSNAATLTVKVPPAITSEPSDQGVSEGENATFSVTATGTAPLSYTWEVLANDGTNWATAPGTSNEASYTAANVQASMDGYLYRCTIRGYGNPAVSRAAKLTVGHAPTITGDTSKTVHKGYYYTGSQYTVTGQPAPTVSLNPDAPSQIRWESGTKSLTIAPGLAPGVYTVTLTAKNGIAPDGTLNFTLTVTDLVIAMTSPISGPIYTDTPVTLTATATNFTNPTYQWYQNTADTVMGATPISGAESDTYTFTPGAAGRVYYFCVVNGDSKTVSNILAVDAQTHLIFTDDPAFDVPTGTAETPITTIDVSSGVSGGTPPYVFSLENAPDWLSITTAGVISGTRPTTATAATTATVRVTDSASPAQTATIEIAVGEVTPVPTYGIALNPATDKTFDPAIKGYGAQTAHTVTVENVGNQPTGALSVALSGADAGSFTLSKTSISSLAKDGSDTFTVVPNIGLEAKTYAATVTVSAAAGNINAIEAKTFNVSFTVNPVPTHGIALDPAADKTFDPAIVGYGAQTAHTVTVGNVGNQPTGALTIALSGADAGCFTLSKTSISDIAKDGSDTFTVVPNTGLEAKTYTAAVTVSGSNVAAQTFNVAFTVNVAPSYGIGIDPWTDKIFDPAAEGYAAQTAHTVTIRNIGNQPTGALTIALSGADAGSFTLSKTAISDIGRGGADTFTVVPKTGLAAKTYAAAVTVSGGNGITARSFNVSFTVTLTPIDPPVSDNTYSGITANQSIAQGASVTFTAIGGGMDNRTPRAGDMRWRPSRWQSGELNGNFDAGYTQTFSTAGMAAGTHTLSITYAKQRYDGARWVNVSPLITDVKNVRFVIVVAPVTGDFEQPLVWLGLLLIACAALTLLRKKRKV